MDFAETEKQRVIYYRYCCLVKQERKKRIDRVHKMTGETTKYAQTHTSCVDSQSGE